MTLHSMRLQLCLLMISGNFNYIVVEGLTNDPMHFNNGHCVDNDEQRSTRLGLCYLQIGLEPFLAKLLPQREESRSGSMRISFGSLRDCVYSIVVVDGVKYLKSDQEILRRY